jgi:WD40 repeat protein
MEETGRRSRLPVHTSELYAAFSPDRSHVLTGGDGPAPRASIWEVATAACLRRLGEHAQPIAALAWTADQRRVASGAFDGAVRVSGADASESVQLLTGHGRYVRSVEFSASGQRLLSGAGDGIVRIWDLRSGALMREFTGHADGVYHATFDPGETRIVSGGRDGTIRVWDVQSGRCLQVIANPAGVQQLAWHADRRHVLSCARDIRLWDLDTGECLRTFPGHDDTVRSVVWSRDHRRVLSGSHDGSARVWESDTGRCLHVLRGGGYIVNAVWSVDEAAVLACDSDGGLFTWA